MGYLKSLSEFSECLLAHVFADVFGSNIGNKRRLNMKRPNKKKLSPTHAMDRPYLSKINMATVSLLQFILNENCKPMRAIVSSGFSPIFVPMFRHISFTI